MAYSKDAKGRFADACRRSAKAFSELLDDDWLRFAETGEADISKIYGDEQRLRVFTAYYLDRLSKQQEDDVFFDPDRFQAVINAKKVLPKVDSEIDESEIPSTSFGDD